MKTISSIDQYVAYCRANGVQSEPLVTKEVVTPTPGVEPGTKIVWAGPSGFSVLEQSWEIVQSLPDPRVAVAEVLSYFGISYSMPLVSWQDFINPPNFDGRQHVGERWRPKDWQVAAGMDPNAEYFRMLSNMAPGTVCNENGHTYVAIIPYGMPFSRVWRKVS